MKLVTKKQQENQFFKKTIPLLYKNKEYSGFLRLFSSQFNPKICLHLVEEDKNAIVFFKKKDTYYLSLRVDLLYKAIIK